MSDSFEIHVFRARDGGRWRASIVDAGGYYLLPGSYALRRWAAHAAITWADTRALHRGSRGRWDDNEPGPQTLRAPTTAEQETD